MHRRPPPAFREGPFAYHQEVVCQIEDLTNLGAGVSRIDGWVLLVPFTIPGETVRARVYRNFDQHSEADLVEVIEPSPNRKEPPCPLFTRCGGCQYQHIDYQTQLELKQKQVIDVFQRVGGIQAPVNLTHPSPLEYGYRSKLTPHYQRFREEGSNPIGFLAHGQRQRIVDVPTCPIATPEINQTLASQRSLLLDPKSRKKPKKAGTLLLRHVAEGVVTDPRQVVTERVGQVVFQFPAGEFFQNNPFILPAFAEDAVRQAIHPGIHTLVDAYCGSGLFALIASRSLRQCIGIEVSEASVRWAQGNAALNRIDNVSFFVGDASEIFARLQCSGDEAAVLIDPPRRGSDSSFLQQLLQFGPRRIVYVSCDPATQARDLKLLLASQAPAYQITRIQPFDLFPQTRHIENIVTLTRS
ncbi:MAG: class I SAM-dependent RNA methyltransferase [Puniceicoccaceae bacterium]